MKSFARVLLAGLSSLVVTSFAAVALADPPVSVCEMPGDISSSIKPNGNAVLSSPGADTGGIIRFSPDVNDFGSAFLKTPITLDATTSFHTYFHARIKLNEKGGNGFTFILQNRSDTTGALGSNGPGIGYKGITPAVVIVFNTSKDATSDDNANHISLVVDYPVAPAVLPAPYAFDKINLDNFWAWIDYDGTTKEIKVFVSDTGDKLDTPLFSFMLPDTLATILKDPNPATTAHAYIGFTSATSNEMPAAEYDILKWEFTTGPAVTCNCGIDACSGGTPVCDPSMKTCSGCTSDHKDGDPNGCPSPDKPVCLPPGGGACGCVKDTDCAEGKYCDTTTTKTGECKSGCKSAGGVDHCGAGQVCSDMTGAVGTCMEAPVPPSSGSGSSSSTSGGDLYVEGSGCVCGIAGGDQESTRALVAAGLFAMVAGLRRKRR